MDLTHFLHRMRLHVQDSTFCRLVSTDQLLFSVKVDFESFGFAPLASQCEVLMKSQASWGSMAGTVDSWLVRPSYIAHRLVLRRF